MKRNVLAALVLGLLTMFVTTGCGASGGHGTSETNWNEADWGDGAWQ